MTLFDLATTNSLESAPWPSGPDALLPWLNARKPVLLQGVYERFPVMRDWRYEWLSKRMTSIRIQRPLEDGIYHYLGFERVPIQEFDRILETGNNAYALEPLRGKGVAQTFPPDFRVELPEFIPESMFRTSNLYVGPGGNKSLLHYDETHSLLMMLEGRKRFMLFPPSETGHLYPYSIFNLRALLQGRVIDSRVDCSAMDYEQYPALRRARGVAGTLEAGQALLIPAGTWHYIEAEGLNVSVNYFWFQNRLRDWLSRPLLDFWFKRRILDGIDLARKVKSALPS